MTILLLRDEQLAARRQIAGAELAPLADSLAADLEPLLSKSPYIPREKALLSRVGGRCETDGTDLEFNPQSPHAHRCPACGRVHTGEWHDRWWLYPYQLWLAERAVHAAVLFALRGDERHAACARAILTGYAAQYLDYPNRDNVLGPSRLFFSTYLESLWLLHVCIATDLLEATGDAKTAALVRDRIAEPAVALIEEYHEGTSNRQVWNGAAIIAARALLGDRPDSEAIAGALADTESIVLQAVGDDGAWYEGDNYHQFAHRGLWYVMTLAERIGYDFQRFTRARFDAGFGVPFRSVLPDFTMPARKDSRYAASLRQWRFAESCELGLARTSDPSLRWALARMYATDIPAGDTGRWRSSGEAERNEAPVRLSRADLGWRTLLFAHAQLPPGAASPPASLTIASQGLTIHRRDGGDVYVALDWGENGGGHGHPDRLNLLFSHGTARWLDDLGTGSYVDPSLHWYRSTLAHNAPLVDGVSQRRVSGELVARAQGDGFDVVTARVSGISPGVLVERTVVTAPGYFIDEVRWQADRIVRFELPVHFDAASATLSFVSAELRGGAGVEDGFEFVRDAEFARINAHSVVRLAAQRGGHSASSTFWSDADADVLRALAPGQPAATTRRFHVIRRVGTGGVIRSVWTWTGAPIDARFSPDGVDVTIGSSTDRHRSGADGWRVDAGDGRHLHAERATLNVGDTPGPRGSAGIDAARLGTASQLPRGSRLAFELDEAHYRRSEESWRDAGEPSARVTIGAEADSIVVDIVVNTPAPIFVPRDAVNPYDNEHPDINGHGVQLYFADEDDSGGWMLVPESPGQVVRIRKLDGWGNAPTPLASWRPVDGGFELQARIPFAAARGRSFAMDVIVNDAEVGRARRRGQLVLSGGRGEFVFLRGDRHHASRLIAFTVT